MMGPALRVYDSLVFGHLHLDLPFTGPEIQDLLNQSLYCIPGFSRFEALGRDPRMIRTDLQIIIL